MKTCKDINCPFISYCSKYDENHEVEGKTCVYAEQLFIRAKMYERQLLEGKHETW